MRGVGVARPRDPREPRSLVAPARSLAAAVRRIPAAARVCAIVAFLNAAAWSLVVPAFQFPDEPAQYAYAEHVAQTGSPPAERPFSSGVDASRDEQLALDDLRSALLGGRGERAGMWSDLEQQRLMRDLHAGASRHSDGYSFGATPQPPLFYALEAVPYRLADGGTLLQRLALMRLLSALMGGATVLLSFLFLREALASRGRGAWARWRWRCSRCSPR